MYYKRITPDGSIDWLKEIETRISNLETPAAGSMTIRDTIVTVDQETGAQTQFGTLPDGTRGFKPFIYDITPPPVATAPVVAAEPGVFVISWDGLFVGAEPAPNDFECCNIIGHKIEGGVTVLSTPVGMTRRPLDITFVQTDVAAFNETWEFSLEAEDYNGNRAAWSARSNTVVMQPIAGEVDLTEIEADIAQAQADADDAQAAAALAQADADQAIQDALDAFNLAGAKGKVIIQATAPAVEDRLPQNLWIDTTGGANTPKRWDTGSSQWLVVTDKVATDAAAAVIVAQARADQAFNDAATAAESAGLAQETADGKNRVWYQDSAPAGTAHKQNDLWFDTNDDNKLSKWNATGNVWEASLLGNSAILANLDAGKITSGYISAMVLQAKSIGVDKLSISSTDNLTIEADFGNLGTSWQLSATKVIDATAGRGSQPALKFINSTATQTSFNLINRIPVGAEDRFRASAWIKSSVALAVDKFQIKLRCYTTATAFTDIVAATSPLLVIDTWTNIHGISPVLPAGTTAIEIFLSVTNPTTGAITTVDYVAVTRAADGKLVVDGAIDGKVITGPYIQTDNTPDEDPASRGIKLNPLGLKAYNASGLKTFDLVASTGDLNVTGTFNSGNAPGVEADSGYTIRAQMGILNFQDWHEVPGLVFQKYNTGTGATSPSGFLFYYFGGILMRSTTPSDGWVQYKNESYVWVTQDGVQMTSSNAGYADVGTSGTDVLDTRSVFYARTFPGDSTFTTNDSSMRMSTVAMPTSSHTDEWLAHWHTRADSLYPRGIAYGGVGKFDQTTGLYNARSIIQAQYDGTFALIGYDASYTKKSEFRSEGTSAANPFLMFMIAQDIEIRAGDNSITDATRAALILQNGGTWLYGPGRTHYFWADATRVGITGSLHINGEPSIKHRRAEFTTSTWYVAGGGAQWDTGPVVLDTSAVRTLNNDFCQAGPVNGSIQFTRAGYYSVQVMVIPQGNPGSGWAKLIHSNGSELLGMDRAQEGAKHECHISTVPIYFQVGEYVRGLLSFSLEHNVDVRWRVVRSILNL